MTDLIQLLIGLAVYWLVCRLATDDDRSPERRAYEDNQ